MRFTPKVESMIRISSQNETKRKILERLEELMDQYSREICADTEENREMFVAAGTVGMIMTIIKNLRE